MTSASGDENPVLYVLAGVNGAGKSSIGGALLRQRGLDYFNPDEFAARAAKAGSEDANSQAWHFGKSRLERAISLRASYAFETTLGGRTMPGLIHQAAQRGFDIIMWYCGLVSVDLHQQRVQERVSRGGHDIPESLIDARWTTSRQNLIALLPDITELKVFDNSQSADGNGIPPPRLVLHLRDQQVMAPEPSRLHQTPDWAAPIVEAALLDKEPDV
ncbi:MAG: AAA family ATPase [Wenzhouxiangella sp.]